MTIACDPAPELEIETEEHRLDRVVVAAAAAAIFGPAAERAVRAAPSRTPGAWERSGRKSIQQGHRLADPFGVGRERGSGNHMTFWIQVEGRPYQVEVDTSHPMTPGARAAHERTAIPPAVLRPRPPHRLAEDAVCRSPIAGRIVAVLAAEGAAVRRHEPVIVIEAMKMEIPIGPDVDGVVKAIRVAPGQLVAARQALFELD